MQDQQSHHKTDFLPDIPVLSVELLRENPKSAIKTFLNNTNQLFNNAYRDGYDALELCRFRSICIDTIIKSLFEHSLFLNKLEVKFTVLALGGYGREEMGLLSDIDILFLHNEKKDSVIKKIADTMLYPLWDNNIEVCNSIRTIDDCEHVSKVDLRSLTSMLDARFIIGEKNLLDVFNKFLKQRFDNRKKIKSFIDAKLEEENKRRQRFGETIFFVEPNIKEGAGGLRDYHTFLWVAKAANFEQRFENIYRLSQISQIQEQDLLHSIGFLWRVRHSLHVLDNSRSDRLGREEQIEIANTMGYKDTDSSIAAEEFMSDYYKNSFVVNYHSRRGIEAVYNKITPKRSFFNFISKKDISENFYKIRRKIYLKDQNILLQPLEILKLIMLAKKKNWELDLCVKDRMSESIQASEMQNMFDTAGVGDLWKEIFNDPILLYQTLFELMLNGWLEKYFPEMEKIMHRIQLDSYHNYTIEYHSINAVHEIANLESLSEMKSFPFASKILGQVKRKNVLMLAVFFHDVGKARGGKHEEVGAEIGRSIATRLGYDSNDIEDASFLIKNHALLPTLAFRRDIKDLNLIERFAQNVKTIELLDMLYLLAFADVRSVARHIWSDWKGTLLDELYKNTVSYLKGSGRDSEQQRLFVKKLDKIHKLIEGVMTRDELSAFLSSMPERYLFTTSPSAIASHITMADILTEKKVVMHTRHNPSKGFTELSVVAKDAPGLFSKIAGVLSINNINIIDAQIYTMPNGTALDLLWVTDSKDRLVYDTNIWEKVYNDFEKAVNDILDVHKTLMLKVKPRFLSKTKERTNFVQVKIDNDVSVTETVIDVFTNDRLGLLYGISRAFFDLGCTIERAKITTNSKQVLDVFYIRDPIEGKILSKDRLKCIEDAIKQAASASTI